MEGWEKNLRKAMFNCKEAKAKAIILNHLPFQAGPEELVDEIFSPSNTCNCHSNFLIH